MPSSVSKAQKRSSVGFVLSKLGTRFGPPGGSPKSRMNVLGDVKDEKVVMGFGSPATTLDGVVPQAQKVADSVT
jgi:hypothetical protein